LTSGRLRGATWFDTAQGVVWLLDAQIHDERHKGSSDAYDVLEGLETAGQLFPEEIDHAWLELDRRCLDTKSFADDVRRDARDLVGMARREGRATGTLAGVPARLAWQTAQGDLPTLYVAVSTRPIRGTRSGFDFPLTNERFCSWRTPSGRQVKACSPRRYSSKKYLLPPLLSGQSGRTNFPRRFRACVGLRSALSVRQSRASRVPVSASFQRFPAASGGMVLGRPRDTKTRLLERVSVCYLVQGRKDSNLQPPVLETGALPIELRPWAGPPSVASRRATSRARTSLRRSRHRLGVDRGVFRPRGRSCVGRRGRRGRPLVVAGRRCAADVPALITTVTPRVPPTRVVSSPRGGGYTGVVAGVPANP
jgi:hypothetical protein